MTQQIADRVKETSTTTGTGPLALAGAAIGYRTFASICSVADTFYYAVEGVNVDGTLTGEWEVGFGTYSGVNTLTRTTVLASSNAGAPVNFSAGTKQVWIDVTAENVKRPIYQNNDAMSWRDSAGTAIVGLLMTAGNIFNVGLQGAAASNGHLALWANGVEKARLLAAGALLIGATAAAGSEKLRVEGQSYMNGEVGVRVAPLTDRSLYVAAPSGAGTVVFGGVLDITGAATATSEVHGIASQVRSTAAAYTVGVASHFAAYGASKGAGSTISSMIGFWAKNAIAVATNNYGFYSDIASASGTYQLYMVGTAPSYINGPVGFNRAPFADSALAVAYPVGSVAASVYPVLVQITAPSTAVVAIYNFYSDVTTVAAAFTLPEINHFRANTTNKGAGSAITNSRGFFASNGIATAVNNYGFYSDINAATTTWQLYMGGTASSFFGGNVGIITQPNPDILLFVGSGNHSSSAAAIVAVQWGTTAPSTATTSLYGARSVLGSQNAAFTIATIAHFEANSTSKGAASTISSSYGFIVGNAIAVAVANYGFYSGINAATNTWQFYGAGTANSYFGAPIGILDNNPLGGSRLLSIGGAATHPSAGTAIFGVNIDYTAPATATGSMYGVNLSLRTAAAAFTLTDMVMFNASTNVKGAGSTITNVFGFFANGAAMVGTNNYGFYSNINSATNTFQLSMQGTAASRFGGPVYHAQDNSTTQAVSALFQGIGAPNNANGNNGDFYLRGDTPGTANQRLYVKSAGAWVGIV